MKIFYRVLLMSILSAALIACATTSPRVSSELAYGKQLFEAGNFKTAMRDLLPLACDGNAEAQYAVGYMYFYGYGVARDADVGKFWINRSAQQGYKPAQQALDLIEKNKAPLLHAGEKK